MTFLAINRLKDDVDPGLLGLVVRDHRGWVARGVAAGRIVQAGRWGGAGGMVIVRADDEAQARQLVREDPLVRAGLVEVELAQLWPDVVT